MDILKIKLVKLSFYPQRCETLQLTIELEPKNTSHKNVSTIYLQYHHWLSNQFNSLVNLMNRISHI
jgi:hypothetical protein